MPGRKLTVEFIFKQIRADNQGYRDVNLFFKEHLQSITVFDIPFISALTVWLNFRFVQLND